LKNNQGEDAIIYAVESSDFSWCGL